jgi:hypothetical protein
MIRPLALSARETLQACHVPAVESEIRLPDQSVESKRHFSPKPTQRSAKSAIFWQIRPSELYLIVT